MKTVKGNLLDLASKNQFDVIAHGCNCFNTQRAGLAKQMSETFGTDTFYMESSGYGDFNKLGQIDFEQRYLEKLKFGGKWVKYVDEEDFMTGVSITIVNCYTQYRYGRDKRHLDYDALRLCMRKIAHIFKDKRIGLPLIGGNLAGGQENIITGIMNEELRGCRVNIGKILKKL